MKAEDLKPGQKFLLVGTVKEGAQSSLNDMATTVHGIPQNTIPVLREADVEPLDGLQLDPEDVMRPGQVHGGDYVVTALALAACLGRIPRNYARHNHPIALAMLKSARGCLATMLAAVDADIQVREGVLSAPDIKLGATTGGTPIPPGPATFTKGKTRS